MVIYFNDLHRLVEHTQSHYCYLLKLPLVVLEEYRSVYKINKHRYTVLYTSYIIHTYVAMYVMYMHGARVIPEKLIFHVV